MVTSQWNLKEYTIKMLFNKNNQLLMDILSNANKNTKVMMSKKYHFIFN